MNQLTKTWNFTTDAWASFKETVAVVRWAPTLFSRTGMRYIKISAALMLLANLVELIGPYFIGQLIAAHAGAVVSQFNLILGGICAAWIGGTTIERYGSNRREKGWNLNDRAKRLKLSREYFKKTPGEVMSESSDIGANQIESSCNGLDSLQFAAYFDGISIVAMVGALTVFLIATDVAAGLWIAAILVANLISIFYINHAIHEEMKVVGKEMRAIHNQLVEYWKQHAYIVATGNEQTVLDWLREAMVIPWSRDYYRWGVWYATVDGVRSCLTAVAMLYIVYTYAWQWNTATLSSIVIWLTMYREQFWRIADTQRKITREIEKIHALRVYIAKQPAFDQGAFKRGDNLDVSIV